MGRMSSWRADATGNKVVGKSDEGCYSGCGNPRRFWQPQLHPRSLWRPVDAVADVEGLPGGAERVARRDLVLCSLLGAQMSRESVIGRRAPWIHDLQQCFRVVSPGWPAD